MFLCLCTVLLLKENQDLFLACEGVELMIRCLKEQRFSAGVYYILALQCTE